MEFAWNVQKKKITDIKGLEKEQNREGYIRNHNIDLSKTSLNYDLVESNFNLYQRIKNRIEDVRSVSRIQKNSIVDCSNIITVSELQFNKWGLEKTKDYFNETYNYFCNEFGKENVVSAKVHLDETAPHMHLHFVPINLENGKLQCKEVLTRIKLNKVHTEAPKFLRSKGFDVVRGEGLTQNNNIKDIYKFKKEKYKELENKTNMLTERLNSLLRISDEIDNISSINIKKTLLGSKISLRDSDYEKILSKFNSLLVENNNLKQENKKLKDKNEDIIKKLDKSNNKIKNFDYRAVSFEKRKKELKEELFKDYRNIKILANRLECNYLQEKKKNDKLECENKLLQRELNELKDFVLKKGLIKKQEKSRKM